MSEARTSLCNVTRRNCILSLKLKAEDEATGKWGTVSASRGPLVPLIVDYDYRSGGNEYVHNLITCKTMMSFIKHWKAGGRLRLWSGLFYMRI